MIGRPDAEAVLRRALRRAHVVLLVGARQVGKTTLARTIVPPQSENYFDLEDPTDLARVLRVLADRKGVPATFLVLGSASPTALRQSSESLAGRVEIIELSGLGPADTADVECLHDCQQPRHRGADRS